MQEICDNIINSWNKYDILYLYNYLIEIKKYDYDFSSKEKNSISNYFLCDSSVFPKYILMHIEKVFGFEINIQNLLTDDCIIEILSTNYDLIHTDNPKKVLVYDEKNINIETSIIDTGIYFEKIDFSNFFNKNCINIENILKKMY